MSSPSSSSPLHPPIPIDPHTIYPSPHPHDQRPPHTHTDPHDDVQDVDQDDFPLPENIYIMRHGERVDQFFGSNWIQRAWIRKDRNGESDVDVDDDDDDDDEDEDKEEKDEKDVNTINYRYEPFHKNMPRANDTIFMPSAEARPKLTHYRHDTPLTETGHAHAHAIGLTLAHSGIRYIYASPSLRCIQTAHNVARGMGYDTITNECIYCKERKELGEMWKWEYQHNDYEWLPYDSQSSHHINTLYEWYQSHLSSQPSHIIHIHQPRHYIINVDEMYQMNEISKRKRAIRRRIQKCEDGEERWIWEYQESETEWRPKDLNASHHINMAYEKWITRTIPSSTSTMTINNNTYHIDIDKMYQKNIQTGTIRAIRRVMSHYTAGVHRCTCFGGIRIEPFLFEWCGWHPTLPHFLTPYQHAQHGLLVDTSYQPLTSVGELSVKETEKHCYVRGAHLMLRLLNAHRHAHLRGNILCVAHAASLDIISHPLVHLPITTSCLDTLHTHLITYHHDQHHKHHTTPSQRIIYPSYATENDAMEMSFHMYAEYCGVAHIRLITTQHGHVWRVCPDSTHRSQLFEKNFQRKFSFFQMYIRQEPHLTHTPPMLPHVSTPKRSSSFSPEDPHVPIGNVMGHHTPCTPADRKILPTSASSTSSHVIHPIITIPSQLHFHTLFPSIHSLTHELATYITSSLHTEQHITSHIASRLTQEQIQSHITSIIPEWGIMCSYEHAYLQTHVTRIYICHHLLLQHPSHPTIASHVWNSCSTYEQQLMDWVILLHDIDKVVCFDGKDGYIRDPGHPFRCAAVALPILIRLCQSHHLSTPSTHDINNWCQYTSTALLPPPQHLTTSFILQDTDTTMRDEERYEKKKPKLMVHDNTKLEKILTDLDTMFPPHSSLVWIADLIKLIMLHQSITWNNTYPAAAPLSFDQISQLISSSHLTSRHITLLALFGLIDSGSYVIGDQKRLHEGTSYVMNTWKKLMQLLRNKKIGISK